MIVAIAALSVSLVGTAVAGPIAEISLNKGEKKQIRKISGKVSNRVANRRITKRAPRLNVASAGFANIANVANAANTANSAKTAEPVGSAGGDLSGSYPNPSIKAGAVDDSKLASPRLFATVAPAGAGAELIRGQGVIGVEGSAPGIVFIQFNRDISGCTWLATYGPPDASFVSAHWATVRLRSGAPDELFVVIRDDEGNQEDGSGVHAEVLCP